MSQRDCVYNNMYLVAYPWPRIPVRIRFSILSPTFHYCPGRYLEDRPSGCKWLITVLGVVGPLPTYV